MLVTNIGLRQHVALQFGIARKEGAKRCAHLAAAAGNCGFYIERHYWIVQRLSEKEPAANIIIGKVDSDAFVVRLRQTARERLRVAGL